MMGVSLPRAGLPLLEARRSLPAKQEGSSPISSRNSVPPSAWLNRPSRRLSAPDRALLVPEQFGLQGFIEAAQLTVTNALPLRALAS